LTSRFARDSAAYGGAALATKGLAILVVPIYAWVLTPADFGIVDLVAIVAAIVASLVPLEIVQAVARFFPEQTDPRERSDYASTALIYALAAYGVFLLAAWLGAGLLVGPIFAESVDVDVVRAAALALTANGIYYVIQSQLRWTLQAREYAATGVAYAIVATAVSLVLVVWMGIGVSGVFVGQAVAGIVGSLLTLRWTLGLYSRRFSGHHFKRMIRFSAPLIPSTLGVVAFIYVDRLLINALMTLEDVGIFGVGYRFALLAQVVASGALAAITPIIYAAHSDPSTPIELARVFRLFTAGSLVAWLALGLFSPEVIAAVTPAAYHGASAVVPFLVPASLLAAAYVFMPGPAIATRTDVIAGVNITGAVANTLLNLALIPRFGIVGAALATLASALMVFSMNAIASQRLYAVPHDWRSLSIAAASVGTIVGLGSLLEPMSIGLIWKASLMLVGVMLLPTLGLIRVDEVRHTLAQFRRIA
jgi:O-antigen/teichoic acid export membrane protein